MPASAPKWLKDEEGKSLLRVLTCGSVDDGKSTLIGRLLYESQLLYDDQLASLKRESKKYGTQSGKIDFALLVDGLAAEREQGITIDVAYRFFTTKKRKFIVADTPGHEQYTRNMATGASTAQCAILLVDARNGIMQQTRRHAFIVSLLGIRHIVLAFNKMDLIKYQQAPYTKAVAEFKEFAKALHFDSITPIPLSALEGENVIKKSSKMAWYKGKALLPFLEQLNIAPAKKPRPFVMPVQWVARPHLDFRGLAGQIAQGAIGKGEEVMILPSKQTAKVKEVVSPKAKTAKAGQSVMLTLNKDIDVSRGDVLCHPKHPLEVSDQIEATLIWMAPAPMLPGRPLWLKLGSNLVGASIMEQKYAINVNTMERTSQKALNLNDIGVCTIALDRPLPISPYNDNRQLGGFILIDRLTNTTLGAGMISFGLARAQNVHWQALTIDKQANAAQKAQKPVILWFTGLSGSGKSTIANELQPLIYAAGGHSTLLDGDNLRHGLTKDLGFKEEDRVENIRRVSEVARLMVDAGLIVLVSFISPFRNERAQARALVEKDEFLEIFVDTTLAQAEKRDPKGLYKKARAGAIKNFTGIDSPYEPPLKPEIHIDTSKRNAKDAAKEILAILQKRKILPETK